MQEQLPEMSEGLVFLHSLGIGRESVSMCVCGREGILWVHTDPFFFSEARRCFLLGIDMTPTQRKSAFPLSKKKQDLKIPDILTTKYVYMNEHHWMHIWPLVVPSQSQPIRKHKRGKRELECTSLNFFFCIINLLAFGKFIIPLNLKVQELK